MARTRTRGYDARMSSHPWREQGGPFRAEQIREGDPYELSDGHAIHCMTAGRRHSNSHTAGALVLATDPGVTREVGIDTGIAFNEHKNLRAPDLVVGMDLREPGWATEAPPLAVEYADVGQDEDHLKKKIAELLALGTRVIWVVRLVGPLRVDVHEPGHPARTVGADDVLHAEGILTNPVPVRALVDQKIAVEAALHNILVGKGYRDLDHVREEAREQGREQGRKQGQEEGRDEGLAELRALLHAQISARGWTLSPALAARVAASTDMATLGRWLVATATAADVEAALR